MTATAESDLFDGITDQLRRCMEEVFYADDAVDDPFVSDFMQGEERLEGTPLARFAGWGPEKYATDTSHGYDVFVEAAEAGFARFQADHGNRLGIADEFDEVALAEAVEAFVYDHAEYLLWGSITLADFQLVVYSLALRVHLGEF